MIRKVSLLEINGNDKVNDYSNINNDDMLVLNGYKYEISVMNRLSHLSVHAVSVVYII